MTSGEDAILNLLGKYFPNSHPHFVMGRGDDCALITVPLAEAFNQTQNNSHLLAVTSDIFAENAHFRNRYFTPAQIGHKALAVNISDLAGNGARPSAFSLNLTLTDEQDFAWLEEFFASMAKLSQQFNMGLSGGDLTKVPSPKICEDYTVNLPNSSLSGSSLSGSHLPNSHLENSHLPDSYLPGSHVPDSHLMNSKALATSKTHIQAESVSGLNIGITAWGDYGHGGIPLLRQKSYTPRNSTQNKPNFEHTSCFAQEGDYLFVVGNIGLARTGLFALEATSNAEEVKDAIKTYPMACNAHLNPMPLVAEGLFLSKFALDHPLFLMDISDGLMRDIPRILARQGILEEKSNPLGARLSITENDLDQEVLTFAKNIGQSPILFAYSGGEDYGLLGICPKDAWASLKSAWQENPQEDSQFAKLWKIGEVCKNNMTLNNTNIEENGFDHFHK